MQAIPWPINGSRGFILTIWTPFLWNLTSKIYIYIYSLLQPSFYTWDQCLFSANMLVAKQLGKHASVYFVFGLLHIYFFILFMPWCYWKKFCSHVGYSHNHTCMLSHVHACRHKSAHWYICVCVWTTNMHNYIYTCLCEENLSFRPHRWTWKFWMPWIPKWNAK